jgi:hypothetical protein
MCTLDMALQELVRKNLIDKSYLPRSAVMGSAHGTAAA